MNIIQAIPLVKEGKKITRQCWDSKAYLYCRVPNLPDDYGIADEDDNDYTFSIDDILAYDWKEVRLLSFDELEQNKYYKIVFDEENNKNVIVRLALTNIFTAYNYIHNRFGLIVISASEIETDGYSVEYAKQLQYREVTLEIKPL